MKKLFFLLVASGAALSAMAQSPSSQSMSGHKHKFAADSLLSHVVFDINLLGGGVSQELTAPSTIGNYRNAIAGVSNTGELKFANGLCYGFDAQIGYFFGKSNHFGLGVGFMYLGQQGDVTLNRFHVEYQSTDQNGSTFRQLITANGPIKEKITVSNINIPLVLKYKHRFSYRLGFTADVGALFNLQVKNSYTTDASFDYEAIYRLTGSGSSVTAVYDNSPVPDPTGDVFYTKAEHTTKNADQPLGDYFYQLRTQAGYNVGLGVKPDRNTGSVSYATGTVGLLVQPSLNYFLSDMVALNIGGFFIYQPFTSTVSSNYMLSDRTGQYGSILNTVTSSNSSSYGLNLGVRFFLGKGKDSDHDGIPDRIDDCPYEYGLAVFHGCPDTDGDGIPDREDSCVRVPGIAKFHGCPDSDGDGIPDKDDACPNQAGPAKYHGCPDRDGDGIIDKDDLCPDKPGLAQFHGCPDTDGDGIPDNEDKCPDVAGPADNHGCPYPPAPTPVETLKVSTPILFELNKTVIREASMPVLELAVEKLNADKESYVIVDGYTDITGKPAYNKALSLRRAKAVKQRLIKMGISAKRIKVVAHGSNSPAADNDTEEGRMKNRRAVMHLSVGE
jgi:outer membrane protein OmpA-like peptidoglycan-associated protein